MSLFKQWVKERKLREGLADGADPVDNFKFNNDDEDFAEDHEKIQQELFSAVMNKYPEETMQFLQGIAQRGDEEIAALLRKMDRDKGPTEFQEPSHPTDKDEVVPPNADSGYSDGLGE